MYVVDRNILFDPECLTEFVSPHEALLGLTDTDIDHASSELYIYK